MGKRAHIPTADIQSYVTPSPIKRRIRKRKINSVNVNASGINRPSKTLRLNSDIADIGDDEDDSLSSNDAQAQHWSSKQANNSSILLNSSLKLNSCGIVEQSPVTTESPRPVYTLRPSIVNGTILYDLTQKPWRLGNPIGKGNFGEIFLASDNIAVPVTNENAKFVVKIEPHSNGPLFVEIHCLMNTAKKENVHTEIDIKKEEDKTSKIPTSTPNGIPEYIASGSHYFGDARYRFLVLQRFDQDLHSLIKNSCVSQKSLLTLAIQIINVLENLHDRGYCHNDVKSQNLMISKCKYYKYKSGAGATGINTVSIKSVSKFDDNYEEKQPTTDSGNSSEQEANDDIDDGDFIIKRKPTYAEIDDDEDFDDGTTTSNSNSIDIYKTPLAKNQKRRCGSNRSSVQYSGTNPVRSCRRMRTFNSTYEEMVNSHYLRPSNKRISYSEFFSDDNDGNPNINVSTDDDESIGFAPVPVSRRLTTGSSSRASSHKKIIASSGKSTRSKVSSSKRLTKRQEKLKNKERKQQKQTEQHKSSITGIRHFGAISNQQSKFATTNNTSTTTTMIPVEAEHIFLIDFGLASKYIDDGIHRPFVMDQRRAHDGTLEFTSRDAHMGAHSRRSDLECLGYNLLFWSQGFLPWKEAAAQHQQEKVHRAKEYLMTDVREMLKQIYGKDVPKYLGEFLHLVGQLAYHDRPQYARYRRLFEKEYQQLGYSLTNMCLNSQDIARTSVRIKKDHGAGKHDIFELNNKLGGGVNHVLNSIMKSGGTPFQERGSLGDRVSPKNLRSKSDSKSLRKKKFTWAEVLSQDPDQIARERAEKEFDREMIEVKERPVKRFEGKPTYAILELLKKNEGQYKNKEDENENDAEINENIDADENDNDDDDEKQDEEDNEELTTDEVEASDASSDDEQGSELDDEEEENSSDSDESIAENNDEEEEHSNADFENDNEEIETDASETSSISAYNERKTCKKNLKSRTSNPVKIITSNRRKALIANSQNNNKSASTTTETTMNRRKSLLKNSTRTRSSDIKASTKTKTLRRNESTRNEIVAKSDVKGRKKYNRGQPAASAAGETGEEPILTRILYEHGRKTQKEQRSNDKETYGRPKRRCLTKTDKAKINGNGRIGVEDDSNSNFSPDVRILFNVWKKMSNESLYAKGSAANANALNHPTAPTVGGGMVTRHYRK